MLNFQIIYFIISLLVGYLVGRFGHCYINKWLKNPSWALHHWTYALLMMLGVSFYPPSLKWIIFAFGLGLFISDFKDFLEMKIIGADEEGERKKFFGID